MGPSSERRAFRSAGRLSRLREELAVLDEQLTQMRWDAEVAHVRALVTENVADRGEDTEAGRHVAALERSRRALVERIVRAEEEHARLLARLFPE